MSKLVYYITSSWQLASKDVAGGFLLAIGDTAVAELW